MSHELKSFLLIYHHSVLYLLTSAFYIYPVNFLKALTNAIGGRSLRSFNLRSSGLSVHSRWRRLMVRSASITFATSIPFGQRVEHCKHVEQIQIVLEFSISSTEPS